ncbi:hypothetical protein [Priestia megaterium]|uniref:hypothetical protein n=1 Tax=Priestia megaterium TaxID=1404 RepID=UPI00244B0EB8|nr:hypothetical protein [Priestia megaterium]MDH2363793.1 hypothetical protein [Priestia megaterium]MED4286436.1 hypothetical protein [Priestia megaterium]
MVRSTFKTLLYIAGICLVGSFILRTFPEANVLWENGKDQFSVFYNQSVASYGVTGTIILIAVVVFLFFGKK